MADAGAEKHVREIIDNGEFTFENKSYKVIQNHKPSRETKTDFYLVARRLDDSKERIFKISYKKPSFSFVENKVKPYRIPFIYGKDWSRILQEQTGSIRDAFNARPLINFKSKKTPITLGWRFEMELNKQSGNRKLSTIVQLGIASQVFWGDSCADEMRDAKVNGKKVPNSGIPDFILIKDDKDIHDIQDVFDDLQDIREYATNHSKIRASFLAQNFIWEPKKNGWTTQGEKRNLAV